VPRVDGKPVAAAAVCVAAVAGGIALVTAGLAVSAAAEGGGGDDAEIALFAATTVSIVDLNAGFPCQLVGLPWGDAETFLRGEGYGISWEVQAAIRDDGTSRRERVRNAPQGSTVIDVERVSAGAVVVGVRMPNDPAAPQLDETRRPCGR
jgi:hypothetical protein